MDLLDGVLQWAHVCTKQKYDGGMAVNTASRWKKETRRDFQQGKVLKGEKKNIRKIPNKKEK